MTGDQTDIFNRLKGMLPSRWFGTATDSVPFVDALLTGLSTSLAFLYSLYQYAKLQTRINTATDGWLDLIAADFFGPTGLPRKTGQSDTSYRNAIKVALLREKATRNAIINTLTSLTGRAPIIIEPQRPSDTGAYGYNPPALLVGASIYRNDWQGNQLLYATARTNLLKFSADLTNAVWVRGASGTGASPTVTANYATAPDGTLTADRVQFSRTDNTGLSTISQTIASVVNTVYSQGVWIKTNDGSNTNLQLYFDGSQTQLVAATPTWQRFINPNRTAADTSRGLQVALRGSGTALSADVSIWGAQLEVGPPTPYIPTTTAAVTVTDYTVSSTGRVTTAQPPVLNAALTAVSPSDGFTTPQPLGTGDGFTTNFAMTIPTGPYAPSGYGVAGGYGSLLLPYQAFVTAFRPRSNVGIANVAGYGISTGGYSQASQAEYASMTMVSGGVTDSDIFAAIDVVKPAGTIVWTRISN